MKITIIGCGKMGGAISKALSKDDRYTLSIYDSNPNAVMPENAKRLESIEESKDSDMTLIAIKPQFITDSFLESIKGNRGNAYISIAAGIPLELLSKAFPGARISRFMPNIGAEVRKSVTAVAFNEEAGKDSKWQESVMEIASSFGSAFKLAESSFSAFIGISGSFIAYALEFIHESAMAGVEAGIPYATSTEIVSDTILSAIGLLKATGRKPSDMIPDVCSAAGTTIEGMRALAENNFAGAIYQAVSRTAEKSIELEEKAKAKIK